MNGSWRDKLSYANLASTLALFLGLGGVSYAALVLPANSVGDRQLRAGAVTPRTLRFPLGAHAVVDAHPADLPKTACNTPLEPGEIAPPCVPPPAGLGDVNRPLRISMRASGQLYISAVLALKNEGATDTVATIGFVVFLDKRRVGDGQIRLGGGQTAYIPSQSLAKAPAGTHTASIAVEARYDSHTPKDAVVSSTSLTAVALPAT